MSLRATAGHPGAGAGWRDSHYGRWPQGCALPLLRDPDSCAGGPAAEDRDLGERGGGLRRALHPRLRALPGGGLCAVCLVPAAAKTGCGGAQSGAAARRGPEQRRDEVVGRWRRAALLHRVLQGTCLGTAAPRRPLAAQLHAAAAGAAAWRCCCLSLCFRASSHDGQASSQSAGCLPAAACSCT